MSEIDLEAIQQAAEEQFIGGKTGSGQKWFASGTWKHGDVYLQVTAVLPEHPIRAFKERADAGADVVLQFYSKDVPSEVEPFVDVSVL